MKPDERARVIYINCLYYTGTKTMAIQCALYIVQMIIEQKLKIDDKIYFPHSLGIFYQAITQYLGFKNYGDEYKVMGLAPYGEPNYVEEISKLINYKNN
mgnify:CR=1 FL=1